MKPEHYKPRRKERLKRKGKISKLKSRMLAVAREEKPVSSARLRDAYDTKTEWVRKLVPRLEEESEAAEEKE